METENYFFVNILGQIDSCWFPLGCPASRIFCQYDITAGPDWEIISGTSFGVTQYSYPSRNRVEELNFNMPIEIMYKSTNPFGWPQITLSFYGNNWWGNECSKGHARLHVPFSGRYGILGEFNNARQQIRAPISIARCSNILSMMLSMITNRNPELRDPKILSEGTKSKGLLTESYGEVIVSLQTITRGAEKMGLDWGQ